MSPELLIFLITAKSYQNHSPIVLKLRYQYGGIYIEDVYPTSDISSGAPLTLPVSRESLETIIRQLVKTYKSSIEIRTGTVVGLTKSANASDLIQGVSIRSPAAGEDLQEEEAAFIIGSSAHLENKLLIPAKTSTL